MGMPAITEEGSRASGLTTSLAPTISATSVVLNSSVDLVQVEELGVGHVGFREQHVHVPGHAPRHRMNGEFHADAAFLKQVRKLADVVLRRATARP